MNAIDELTPLAPTITPPPVRKADTLRTDPYADAPSDALFEVVNTVRVEKAMSSREQTIGSILNEFLGPHCRISGIGRSYTETTFAIPARSNDRRPDVAFVSYSRWPKNRPVPTVNAWPVVPDLVAEIVSPTDKLFDVFDKVEEYFESGVRLVWLVRSNVERVYVLSSPTQWAVLNRTDELTGGDVVPGFELSLTELFPEYPEEATP